ncbi:MAG: N-acetyl-gamma-glutamyl-phosphate reductase [Clostridium sp.]|nr:N-acetyl-gamma-glutamyl-phosphate reductase [Clostridium sp.]
MDAKKVKVGIVGGAGYTAGELIRLLINHPCAEIAWVQSSSNAGNRIAEVHQGLWGDTDMLFSAEADLAGVDVLFLCSGHGFSHQFWAENEMPESLKVIDLAQDFRDESDGYVYGLPELNKSRIAAARKIANPGCFATAIQLSLLPMSASGLLPKDIHVTAVTGSTGAGVKPGATTHFSWRDNNLSVYKAFSHQHLAEIERSLSKLQPGLGHSVNFVPVRGDFPRGIFSMAYFDTDLSVEKAREIYEDFYSDATFTHVIGKSVDLKQAVNTNKAIISLEKHNDKLLVLCAIDNLLKGASGQAVQNMNLMCGFDEAAGLRLKPSAF